jgi:hypothetical protein
MPPLFLAALPVIIVVVVVFMLVVIIVVVRLRRLWVRCGRLWLRFRRRRLRGGRWAVAWLRRHIVTDQQGRPAAAALRAFWG